MLTGTAYTVSKTSAKAMLKTAINKALSTMHRRQREKNESSYFIPFTKLPSCEQSPGTFEALVLFTDSMERPGISKLLRIKLTNNSDFFLHEAPRTVFTSI